MFGGPNSDGATTRCETLQLRGCCHLLNVPAVRSAAVLLLLKSPGRGCTLPQDLVPTACRSAGAGPREQALDRSTIPDTCLKGPATKPFEEALRLREDLASCDCCANCVSCNGVTRLPSGVGSLLWSGLWLCSKDIAGLEWRPPRAAGLAERLGTGGCTSW